MRDVRTALNIADLFTKPVPRDKIQALAGKLLGYEPVDYDEINKGFTVPKQHAVKGNVHEGLRVKDML